MKYIRTKDGIYDKVSEDFVYASKPPMYELTKNGVHIKYEFCHNCKLADTIEELCDCYSYGTETTRDNSVAKGWNINNRKIYGCILTDKGLIYVAKMNDKGEFELL